MKVPLPPSKRRSSFFVNIFIFTLLFFVLVAVILGSLNDARKPAVYLYPVEDMNVKVKVDVNGFMYKDIPDYNNGWDVFVTKEGIIENTYDYLFYEAALFKVSLPNTGWVVEQGNLENWFKIKLTELGLNEKESRQFMEYWLSEMPVANYYEVKLLEKDFLDENMKLSISPEPDTVIRLIFYFTPMKEYKNIEEPIIVTPNREGFTVVEWGGLLD